MTMETTTSSMRRAVRAFDIPGFRWLWLSVTFTWTGWVVTTLTHGWFMLQLTDSPFWVGVGVGVRGAVQAVGSLPGGALADRFDRRRVLLVTQSMSALAALVMAVLVLGGAARLWQVLVFMAFMGTLGSVDRPATNGLYYDLVGPERLLNASALRSIGQSATNIAAALAGGAILQWLGVGHNFLFVSGLHLLGFATLLMLRSAVTVTNLVGPLTRGIAEGVRYATRNPPVRVLLGLSLIIEAFGFASLTMMPVVARDVLRVGGLGLGFLTAAGGLGALLATLRLATRSRVRNQPRLLLIAAIAFGLTIALFGQSRWMPLSLVLAAAVFACGVTYDVTMSAALPTMTSDEMRGRVLGLFAATLAFSQMGGLVVGSVATVLGAPVAITMNGLLAAAGAGLLRGRFGSIPVDPRSPAGDRT